VNFLFILVDQGCFFVQEKNRKVLSKSFYATLESFQEGEGLLLQQNPRIPLHVFFDTQDQTYKREILPSMRAGMRRKILKHRCDSKDSECHWTKEDKNTYLFVDLKLSKAQKVWLQFLETLPNPIAPPRLIPFEMAARVQEKVCTVLMYQEESIGLRQVVVNEGRFLLTRFIRPPFFVTPAKAGAQGAKQDLATGNSHESGDGVQVALPSRG
jgi:hypothetical protein